MTQQRSALVILSGGQDSTVCLYWARDYDLEHIHAITFDYGQRHRREIDAARKIAAMAGVTSHEVVELGPILKGRSPLTDPDQPLETYANYQEMEKIIGDRVELTFVPMRNALFLTLAANRAACLGATWLITGVCQQDNANYPDCRQQFITDQERTINSALGFDLLSNNYIEIKTPLMDRSKADSIRAAIDMPGCWEALAYSHTAYDGSYPPTGNDHASVLRAQGFLEAGYPDPLIMRAWKERAIDRLPSTSNYKDADVIR